MENQKNTVSYENRIQWYLDAKFGLFIHWGAYSVQGIEASWPIMAPRLSDAMFGTSTDIDQKDYINLPKCFNPVDFDADKWVSIAKSAGMKYIVITTKHHDGFCMFDAPNTDYKITNTPFGRDVCLELAKACKRANMKLGFYYSPPDMHHPGYRDTSKKSTKNWLGEPKREEWADYLDYMESHIRKLLTDYGDISIIWFDGLCYHEKYDPQRFHKLIHELNPDTLINDRLGDDYDFVTPEQFIPHGGIPIKTGEPPSGNSYKSEKFFRTVLTLFKLPIIRGWMYKQMHKYAEGTLELASVTQENNPPIERYQPWETCMTMGQSWAYNPKEENWKLSSDLVKNLSTIVGHGGNYLLDVGPTDLGVFPDEAIERLSYIGEWMKNNSEAIYESTYTKYSDMPWGTTTKKGNRIYLHISCLPEDNKLIIDDFDLSVKSVLTLKGDLVSFMQNDNILEITLPKDITDNDVSIMVVEI